ncbi:MAG: MBL fold metallo-hydrolase [Desulfopila sp.]
MSEVSEGKRDIGRCKSVRIKCVSELGWHDSNTVVEDIRLAGGTATSQWHIPWDNDNGAGCCSLIDIESIDGTHHKFLLDTGWNSQYMEEAFRREGIDRMLAEGEIEFLFISHEHMDHYWGVETTLKYNPQLPVIVPETFSEKGLRFLAGAQFPVPKAGNSVAHRGRLVKSSPKGISPLYAGCVSVTFDLPIDLGVRGEQSLFFHLQERGIVCVTGCCHQSILTLADFARDNIAGGETLYGVYGGLHIAPFGPMNPDREHIISEMAKYGFAKIACNHCTGQVAIDKMIELGYPVVPGTGRFGSQGDRHIGNGDEVVF